MTQMRDRGVYLLRILYELEAYYPKRVALDVVFEKSGWSVKEFKQVDSYLKQKGWIRGVGSISEGLIHPDGDLTITHTGLDALEEAIRYRMSLSLLAEKIARWLNERDPLGRGVDDIELVQALEIDQESYENAMRELLDLGLVETPKSRAHRDSFVPFPKLTEAGRLAIKNGFAQPGISPISQQIGVQINAPVSESPIAGIVGSEDVTVNQAIESGDHEQLLEISAAYLDQIIDLVKDDLQKNQLVSYIQTVEKLKSTMADESLDSGRLRKLLSIVTFLDNANGAIELGEKGWRLAKLVLPYVLILVRIIGHLTA